MIEKILNIQLMFMVFSISGNISEMIRLVVDRINVVNLVVVLCVFDGNSFGIRIYMMGFYVVW